MQHYANGALTANRVGIGIYESRIGRASALSCPLGDIQAF